MKAVMKLAMDIRKQARETVLPVRYLIFGPFSCDVTQSGYACLVH